MPEQLVIIHVSLITELAQWMTFVSAVVLVTKATVGSQVLAAIVLPL